MTDYLISVAVGAIVFALTTALLRSRIEIRRLRNELLDRKAAAEAALRRLQNEMLGWKAAAEAAQTTADYYKRELDNERVKQKIDRIESQIDEKKAQIKKLVTPQSERPKQHYEREPQTQRTATTPPPAPQTTTTYPREDTLIGGVAGFGLGMAAASALSSSGSESRCDRSDYSSSSSSYDSGSSDSGSSCSSD